MAGAEFVGGMALFAVVGCAAGFVTWRVLSRRLVELDLLERAVAGMLVFVAAIIAIHLLPLALGVLGRGSVVAAAALTAVLALAVPSVRLGPEPEPRRESPESPRWSVVLAVVVAAAVAAVALVNLREWLPAVFVGVDTATFHLPNAARWIQTGSLWQIDQFIPLQAQGYYPNHGELLHLWALLPFHNEFLVRPVVVALLGAWALALVAVGRELGVAPAARVLVACALVTVPIIGISTIPRAMPDILLYTTVTAGLLFLLRHGRSGRRSDLVLAGLGLGIGFGTKWYGVTTAAIAVVVWLGLRLVRDRAAWRRTTGDAAIVVGAIAAAGGVWLVRNVIEIGNPFFPVRIAPFGITIFDAPADTTRDQVGFSIAHYAGDLDVLVDIAGEILDGAGSAVPLAVALALAAAITALRRRDGRTLALVAGATLLAGAYAVTPYSALGFEGDPALAEFNTRYLVPALTCAVLAGAWLAGRGAIGALVQVGLAAVALGALSDAYGPLRPRSTVAIAVAFAILAALVVAARRVARTRPPVPRRALALGAVAVVALGAVGYARRTEERFNGVRYAEADPAFRTVAAFGDDGYRVGIAGLWSLQGVTPVWQAFGEEITNEVEYVGAFRRGFLTEYEDAGSFAAAARRDRLDLLIVGRGLIPARHVPEENWAAAAGYVELTRSKRLILYAKPALAARVR